MLPEKKSPKIPNLQGKPSGQVEASEVIDSRDSDFEQMTTTQKH